MTTPAPDPRNALLAARRDALRQAAELVIMRQKALATAEALARAAERMGAEKGDDAAGVDVTRGSVLE